MKARWVFGTEWGWCVEVVKKPHPLRTLFTWTLCVLLTVTLFCAILIFGGT